MHMTANMFQNILSLSCWFFFESTFRELSDEDQYARVSVISQLFALFYFQQISYQ